MWGQKFMFVYLLIILSYDIVINGRVGDHAIKWNKQNTIT